MAEAMVLSEKRIAEMYPPTDTTYSAKAAWYAIRRGLTIAVITDEEFALYSHDIRFLYERSNELLKLLYSHRNGVKMEFVVDHDKLSNNQLIVAFSVF